MSVKQFGATAVFFAIMGCSFAFHVSNLPLGGKACTTYNARSISMSSASSEIKRQAESSQGQSTLNRRSLLSGALTGVLALPLVINNKLAVADTPVSTSQGSVFEDSERGFQVTIPSGWTQGSAGSLNGFGALIACIVCFLSLESNYLRMV